MSHEENKTRDEQHTILGLSQLAQQWEHLLFSTGGAICLNKSFWYLISWQWSKQGIARLCSIDSAPGVMELTSGCQLDKVVEVPRIDATSCYRTLGVRISPSGSNSLAISTLRQQSVDFATRIATSKLTRKAAYWAYWQYYTPKSGFPAPALTLTKAQCDRIQAPALRATLSKLHVNRNTSRAIVFGPANFAGLSLPSLYTI
jgi:hypothetical protein